MKKGRGSFGLPDLVFKPLSSGVALGRYFTFLSPFPLCKVG